MLAHSVNVADLFLDLVAQMGHNGSMMFGHSIPKSLLGVNWIASATYLPHVKGIQPRWSTMSCTYLEGALKKVSIWVIWQRSESLRGAGTHSKIWVRRRLHDPATA